MIRALLRDKFIVDNATFFTGSMIVAILNYAFHPVMSRLMTAEDFGEVQALISLTYFSSILLTICGTMIVNITANDAACSSMQCNKTVSQIYKLSVYIIVIVAIGIVAVSPQLKSILQFGSASSFLPLVPILLIGVPFTFYSAYVRGIGRFGHLSIANIIVSGGKLILAMFFIAMGAHVFGVLSAFFCATTIALVYLYFIVRGSFRIRMDEKIALTTPLRAELSYSVVIFCALGYITFLYASDVLFVKHFFSPDDAGMYSGLATIARIVFFATASVAGVLLPSIKIDGRLEQNERILQKAVGITVIIGFFLWGIFALAPEFIIATLIGTSYLPVAGLLPLAGGCMFLISLVNVLFMYFLALRDRRLIGISLGGIILLVGMLVLWHETFFAIIVNYAICAFVMIVICILMLTTSRSRSLRQYNT